MSTETIVSRDLEGRGGVINHGVTSSGDAAYDHLLAAGINLKRGQPDAGGGDHHRRAAPAPRWNEADAVTADERLRSYTVRLGIARPPVPRCT